MSEQDSECKIWKYFENSVESQQGKKLKNTPFLSCFSEGGEMEE